MLQDLCCGRCSYLLGGGCSQFLSTWMELYQLDEVRARRVVSKGDSHHRCKQNCHVMDFLPPQAKKRMFLDSGLIF